MTISPARIISFKIINSFFKKDFNIDNAIYKYSNDMNLSSSDKSLLMEIVYGTLRNKTLLEKIIVSFSYAGIDKINDKILTILLISVYQILYLDRVPDYAILNDAVNLAKKNSTIKSASYVNAVLRKISNEENRDGINKIIRESDLSVKYSHPEWFIKKISGQYGDEQTESALKFNNSIAPLDLRINLKMINADDFIQEIKRYYPESVVEKTKYSPDGVRIFSSIIPSQIPGFAEGLFTIQDEAAQLPALLMNVKPGESVLDYCSAPGGKTCHIAQLNPGSKIVATDISDERLKLVEENAKRLKIDNIEIITISELHKRSDEGRIEKFDHILVDAPCSGSGTIRRHPEIRWRINDKRINELNKTQDEILKKVPHLLKENGTLYYSTCSILKEENQNTIGRFISSNKEYKVIPFEIQNNTNIYNLLSSEGYLITCPHKHNMDGFFAVRLRKI